MGFLATLFLAIIFGTLGLVRPRVGFYILLGLFIFFEELGLGFTTYRGSWVFNAFFVGFYGIRLIEVLTISMYIPMLLTLKPSKDRPSVFGVEQFIAITIIVWSAILTALEYSYTKKVEVGTWRLLVTGMMQFHMMVVLFVKEEDRAKLLKVFVYMLAIRAFIGLGMYAAGYGVQSFRGRVPFFYDSKQIEAFGLGIIILWVLLLNSAAIKKEFRFFSQPVAILMLIILLAAVGGSIRRTIWATTLLGLIFAMVLSRRTTIVHYLAVVIAAAVTVATLLLAPGLDDFRSHMGKYVASMNLLNDYQLTQNKENEVHIDNLDSYSKMITENPDIILVGAHGPSAVNYAMLMAEYSEGGRLGMAHNGPLRSIISFGVVGLLCYFALFFITIKRTYIIYTAKRDDHALSSAALACGAVLILEFCATMFFVPPFYTSSKGLFYTFFAMFILGTSSADALRYRAEARPIRNEPTRLSRPMQAPRPYQF